MRFAATQSGQQAKQRRRFASDLFENRFDQEIGFDQGSVEIDDQRTIARKRRRDVAGFDGHNRHSRSIFKICSTAEYWVRPFAQAHLVAAVWSADILGSRS